MGKRLKNALDGRWGQMMAAVAVAPWAILPIIAAFILLLRFDAVLDVLSGERYFMEATVQYLEFVTLYAMFGLVIAYVILLVFGIPVHLYFASRGYHKPQGYILVGAIGAALIGLLTGVELTFALVLTACGAAVSGTFWAICSK